MVSIFLGYIVSTMFSFMETWCMLFWGLPGFPKITQLHITYGCSLRLTLEIKSTSIQLVQNPDIIYIAMKYHYITPRISTIQVPYHQSRTSILPSLFNGFTTKLSHHSSSFPCCMLNAVKLWQRVIGSSSVWLPHIAINVAVNSPVHGPRWPLSCRLN